MNIKRSVSGREADASAEFDDSSPLATNFKPPILRKGKLLLVDLAGSERVLKSGTLNFLDLITKMSILSLVTGFDLIVSFHRFTLDR